MVLVMSNYNFEKDIFILGIETSCDETSASVVRNGRYILSNIISSQIDLHKRYGGVVPEIASRKHIENIDIVIKEAIYSSNIKVCDIDAIAVTYGPGLVGALLVGVAEAKALSYAIKKPLIGIHHIEGHISANYIQNLDFEPPYIALVVSGGHSHIFYVEDYGKYEIMGCTRDDAAGEAYDKVARVLGLSYPGGPQIEKIARNGDSKAINFPKALLNEDNYDFSFSGIKSAVLNYINKEKMLGNTINIENIAASFQYAVIEVLVNKTIKAAKNKNVNKIAIAGGVASNSALRLALKNACDKEGFYISIPDAILCTDNAAMIASAGYYKYIKGIKNDLSLNAIPNLKLE